MLFLIFHRTSDRLAELERSAEPEMVEPEPEMVETEPDMVKPEPDIEPEWFAEGMRVVDWLDV